MKTKLRLILTALLCSMSVIPAIGQNSVITYQGRVQSGGGGFTGTGQFKFALVTSLNFNAPATAEAVVNGEFVTAVTPIATGNGYLTPPVVTVVGGGGSGATATAILSGDGPGSFRFGRVESYVVDSPGSGYTSTPRVIVGPPPESIFFTTYWSNDKTGLSASPVLGGSEPVDAVSVSVDGGLFTVGLGDTNLFNMTELGVDIFGHPDMELRIWFDDGVDGFAALSPTQPLSSVPYAMTADTIRNPSFIGTTDEQPLEFFVNNMRVLRIEENGDGSDPGTTTDDAPNIIGGSEANYAEEGVVGATIAGGGTANYADEFFRPNIVTGDYGSVLGGFGNTAGWASTAMGVDTIASGNVSTAMGSNTEASGNHSTAIGDATLASGDNSIAMGFFTEASGLSSTAMGYRTTASGSYSTAMGYKAKANHRGAFVWGDSTDTDFSSIQDDEFAIRASGGMRVSSANTIITGFNLENTTIPTGSGKWLQQVVGSGVAGRVGNFEIWYVGAGGSSLTLQPGGNVGVGTTSPAFKLHVNGSAGKPGGGSWSTASDARLKDIGQPFTRGLDDLEKIQPTHYRYSENNALDLPSDREYIGLIAQNVQASIPEAIEQNDTGYLHVNNDPILWTMLNGIKELNQKLENKLEQRDSKIKELEQRLERLEQLLTRQN